MDGPPLPDELVSSVHELRGALTDLITGLGGDPWRPQEVSRRFGVDKSLAWKVSRVVSAAEPGSALRHIPGAAAMDILMRALSRAGASTEAVHRAKTAVEAFREVVERTVGDRSTLEIVLDAMPAPRRDRLVMSRKLAFRGNSGIWGVQARVRVNTVFLTPNLQDRSMVDSVLVGGWVDFRRLRPDASWTLFRRKSYIGDASTVSTGRPVDTNAPPDGSLALHQFCSSPAPEVVLEEEDGFIAHRIGPGTVGTSGQFTTFFAAYSAGVGRRRAEHLEQEHGEFFASVGAPVETLMFDFLVHHDCEFALRAEPAVFGAIRSDTLRLDPRDRLPIMPLRLELGSRPPVVATPLVPRYGELIDHVLEARGWRADHFTGLRYLLDYPPFPSTMTLRFPLERP